ncbi:MAG: hypothetical protein AAGC55_08435 [Myxococcota bacterium]
MRVCIVAAIATVLVPALSDPRLARAQDAAQPALSCSRPPASISVTGAGRTLCIPVHEKVLVTIALPDGTAVTIPEDTRFGVVEVPEQSKAYLSTREDTPVGAESSAKLMAKEFEATLILRKVNQPSMVRGEIQLRYVSEEMAAIQARINTLTGEVDTLTAEIEQRSATSGKARERARRTLAHYRRQLEQIRATLAQTEGERDTAVAELGDLRTAFDAFRKQVTEQRQSQINEQFRLEAMALARDTGRTLNKSGATRPIFTERLWLGMVRAAWQGNAFRLVADVGVLRGRPFQLDRVKAHGPGGQSIEVRFAIVEHPVIYAGQPGRIVLEFKVPPALDEATITFQLFEKDADDSAISATVFPPEWRDGRILVPMTDEELAEKEREEAEARREAERQRRGRQVLVSVQGFYGAYFMRDGAGPGGTNVSRIDASSLTGLGLRLAKGFNPGFALEAEIVGARTGTAHWDDITVNNAQGDLTREAKLGRLTVAAVGRMGDILNPYIRAGGGAQFASYEAQFSGETNLESSTEFTYFLTFGGGIDARLSENIVLGVALHLEPSILSDKLFESSFRAGIHISYNWNP